MALFGPFVHRRRKQLSLDGLVPGIEYGRYQGGAQYASISGNSGRVAGGPAGRPAEEYDPITAVYPTAPDYEQPDPRDAIAFEPRTPQLRFEPRPRSPEAISYDDAPMNEALFQHAMDGVVTSMERFEAPEQIPADHDVRLNPVLLDGPYWSDIETPEIASEALGTSYADLLTGSPGLMADHGAAPEEFFPGLEALVDPAGMSATTPEMPMYDDAAMPGPGATTPSLDELVAQIDPHPAMPEPMPPDPIHEQYDAFDQQMQQLMNPFGMPGPFG